MSEDETGLRVELDPPTKAELFIEQVERDDIDGLSVGVVFEHDETEELEDGSTTWTVHKAKLFEVSFTAHPAFADTEVSIAAEQIRPEPIVVHNVELLAKDWEDESNEHDAETDTPVDVPEEVIELLNRQRQPTERMRLENESLRLAR